MSGDSDLEILDTWSPAGLPQGAGRGGAGAGALPREPGLAAPFGHEVLGWAARPGLTGDE